MNRTDEHIKFNAMICDAINLICTDKEKALELFIGAIDYMKTVDPKMKLQWDGTGATYPHDLIIRAQKRVEDWDTYCKTHLEIDKYLKAETKRMQKELINIPPSKFFGGK